MKHIKLVPSIGTEHVLLGILRVNARLAKRIPEDLDALRKHLLLSATEWLGSPGVDVQLSAAAKRVMSLAEQGALTLGHDNVASDHLFLAVLRQTDSVEGRTLATYGIDPWPGVNVADRPNDEQSPCLLVSGVTYHD